ncbi:hypothetical protein FDK21_01890 [Cohaesibacter sp. CAU 1516]|uniref:cell division protein FtsL n=1 Tax=Cohaesibacter sp. CAU 1516 TaxID=2576038 RepID=UPI0010FD8794|nr:hypothetical protein [Cohaesibacter sp. CAU 1516]TLP48434.1 hypothetical protein FDK21_01890 [Cohaesibacter sp. CAU 1516]
MSRLINTVLFLFVLLGAFWLYQVKHEAKEEESRIVKLEQQIEDEKEALLLLKAEWSYLNRPERVQKLSERFSEELGLSEVQPYQIGTVADLPERVQEPSEVGADKPTIDEFLKQAQPTAVIVE